jgi:hypothetical protein
MKGMKITLSILTEEYVVPEILGGGEEGREAACYRSRKRITFTMMLMINFITVQLTWKLFQNRLLPRC